MKRYLIMAAVIGCGGAPEGPQDARVVYQSIAVMGQTTAIHAVSDPMGIECGPSTTQCQHGFVLGSVVHLHIEQVDFTCGTVTVSVHVGDGSGGTLSVPFDQDIHAYDTDYMINCSPP